MSSSALNILQVSHTLKLIDFDGSSSFKNSEYDGLKYSSACLPPEMFWKGADGVVKVRSAQGWSPTAGYELLLAAPAHDMWSLGCVLYLLCTGTTLFQSSVCDDLMFERDVNDVWEWTEATRRSKLEQVKDYLARNLLSLLLMKNPLSRLDAAHVLSHPFLTGITGTRLQGGEPQWDVFLSYRVDSDSGHVEELYNELLERGLKPWWDKKCLLPGQNWEEGFCSGLVSSRCMVCLLSRGAVKNPTKPRNNFEFLQEDSKCDNVLLEWRLALELKERGMIEGIFPVMIGDKGPDGEYSNYFSSGCNPNPPDKVVEAVENKLREHLDREGLGSPYNDRLTVKAICTAVLANQGGFYSGMRPTFFHAIVASICNMVASCKVISNAYSSGGIMI